MTEVATTGGCLCGKVRYRLSGPPASYGACHCGMCRRFSGGIELGIEIQPGGIEWEATDSLRIFASSEWAERGFCGNCGSSLFWRLTMAGPMQGLMSLAAGSLDSLDGLELTHEVYIDHKPAGHAFEGDRKRLTEAEVLEMAGVAPEGGS